MEWAMSEVTSGTLSVRSAVIEYDVPRSTLHDQMSEKVFPGAEWGPSLLDSDEEEEFVDFLLGCAEVGCPKTVKKVRAIVGTCLALNHNKKTLLVPSQIMLARTLSDLSGNEVQQRQLLSTLGLNIPSDPARLAVAQYAYSHCLLSKRHVW